MTILDGVILVVYMLAILAMGFLVGRGNESGDDYFNGGHSMPWYALGLSVGLTMISANSFIGGPGWGFADGLMGAMVNITVPISICFVTYTILPVIYDAKVTTVYEYVYKRLGTRSRLLNVVAWLAQSLIFVGGFVYTPSLVLQAVTGIDMDIWIPVIMGLAIVYTVAGGIKAVIWTDMVQGIILGVGLICGVAVAIGKLGMPMNEAMEIARNADLLRSFDFAFDVSNLNMWCVVLAGGAQWIGYFGFDQAQVQRYITAKDMRTVKKTGIMSSIAMQLIYWLCFFMGVVLFIFYKSNPSTLDFANANNIMIDFLLNYCPKGLLGLLLAATFAAAMSSIDSTLNSLTAVFTKDIYEPYIAKREGTSLKQSMGFTVVFGVLIVGFVYLYLGDNTTSILATIGALLAPFGALLTGIMLVCCFMPSANDKGTFYGSLISAALSYGVGKLIPNQHYLWAYLYGAIFCMIFTWIFSKFFYNEAEYKEKYYYTIQGTRERVKGMTDASGCSVEPLKMDMYGWIMIAVLAVQCVVLVIIQ